MFHPLVIIFILQQDKEGRTIDLSCGLVVTPLNEAHKLVSGEAEGQSSQGSSAETTKEGDK